MAWLGPPVLLAKVRQVGQGLRNAEALHEQRDERVHYLDLVMRCGDHGQHPDVPLSWSLSEEEIEHIDEALDANLSGDLAR